VSGTVLAAVSRVVLADGRALIHADGIKLEVDAELVRGLVGDGGGRRALLLAWSLHDLPSIGALAASVPEDEAPDQAADSAPAEAPVAASDQRRVDEAFSALFRSAPVPEDEAPDQAADSAPAEAPIAASNQRRVDEEFSALFRSAPVASEPNTAVPSPLEMIFSMLKPS
jgi:hypothetical protein